MTDYGDRILDERAGDIEVGDIVRIGNQPLTWEVLSIWRREESAPQAATLKSGQTGRTMTVAADRLRLFAAKVTPERMTTALPEMLARELAARVPSLSLEDGVLVHTTVLMEPQRRHLVEIHVFDITEKEEADAKHD